MTQGRLLRDELLDGLRSHGKQSACELAARLGRNAKLVMRHLADLSDEGLVVCERCRCVTTGWLRRKIRGMYGQVMFG